MADLLLLHILFITVAVGTAQRQDLAKRETCDASMLRTRQPTFGTVVSLGRAPWPTVDPFLFCAYHNDLYPSAERGTLGPPLRLLQRRPMGSDFTGMDGWSMYHGQRVPGFPQHPHFGFETITVTLQGVVDHFDSLGATGRYGNGDVQWMTAGNGVQHSEMFPLLNDGGRSGGNPVELFQLWLNLPSHKKDSAKPFFSMQWAERTALHHISPSVAVKVVAGTFFNTSAADAPPPDSWAADPAHDVAVWLVNVRLAASDAVDGTHGRLELPVGSPGSRRMVYYVRGPRATSTRVVSGVPAGVRSECGGGEGDEVSLLPLQAVEAAADARMTLNVNCDGASLSGDDEKEVVLLVLQGKPIGEPIVQQGPFVTNSNDQMRRVQAEYRRTQFGGWPWAAPDVTHERSQSRFAKPSAIADPEYPPTDARS